MSKLRKKAGKGKSKSRTLPITVLSILAGCTSETGSGDGEGVLTATPTTVQVGQNTQITADYTNSGCLEASIIRINNGQSTQTFTVGPSEYTKTTTAQYQTAGTKTATAELDCLNPQKTYNTNSLEITVNGTGTTGTSGTSGTTGTSGSTSTGTSGSKKGKKRGQIYFPCFLGSLSLVESTQYPLTYSRLYRLAVPL